MRINVPHHLKKLSKKVDYNFGLGYLLFFGALWLIFNAIIMLIVGYYAFDKKRMEAESTDQAVKVEPNTVTPVTAES